MTSNTARPSSFTDELWHSIEPIYAAILRHPFIAGLTDGSLPRESFEFYAVQDALYLREFARSLAIAAARAPKADASAAGKGTAASSPKASAAVTRGLGPPSRWYFAVAASNAARGFTGRA